MVFAVDGVATKCDNNRVFDFYFGKDLNTYEMKNFKSQIESTYLLNLSGNL